MAKGVQGKSGLQGIFPIWCNSWAQFLVGVCAFRIERLGGGRVFDLTKDLSSVLLREKPLLKAMLHLKAYHATLEE